MKKNKKFEEIINKALYGKTATEMMVKDMQEEEHYKIKHSSQPTHMNKKLISKCCGAEVEKCVDYENSYDCSKCGKHLFSDDVITQPIQKEEESPLKKIYNDLLNQKELTMIPPFQSAPSDTFIEEKKDTPICEAIKEFERLKNLSETVRDRIYLDGVISVLETFKDKEKTFLKSSLQEQREMIDRGWKKVIEENVPPEEMMLELKKLLK